MQNTLVQSLIRGTPQDKVVKEFAKKMNVSLSQAGRLIATETAYFTTIGEFDSLNNLGVKQYEILATLDHRTSDIYRHLDGKIFNMSDKKTGITAPPFHCWCRTCIIPHTPKLKGSKRATRNDEGKTYYIDGNMKYNDWKKVFVDKTMTFEEWKSKNKDSIIKVDKITLYAKPNSITEKISAKGGIERNFYDENGRQYKQIANNNHGNPKNHPYGKHGEHAHDYIYDEQGNLKRTTRELTNEERKEVQDIL